MASKPRSHLDRVNPRRRKQAARLADIARRRREGTTAQRGYGSRWRRASIAFRRQHPLCVACLEVGRTMPSQVVDHIIPHKGDQKLFWDRTNWQALCKGCHDSKTGRERARP